MDHGSGTVVVNFGDRALVETDHGDLLRCSVRGKRLRAVCGDVVDWDTADADSGVITRIAERHHVLERSDGRGGTTPIASGLDRVLIVAAAEPEPDLVLLDRYLVMTELGGMQAAILLNKADLAPEGFLERFDEFRLAGYPVWSCSAVAGDGIDTLRTELTGAVTILVGQSGVGKSSLLNALIPDLAIQTGVLSVGSGEGRHTTTTTKRYRIPGGGALVDSPGVREFWLPKMSASDLVSGFREISAASIHCRFRNCIHGNEPDCAVRDAVSQGHIPKRRFDSYQQLSRTVAT